MIRKFINYINQDDANKWLELGEFTIEPPYGVESLQIIACTADFDTVPATTFDTWISHLEAVTFEDNHFTLISGESFGVKYIRENYYKTFLECFKSENFM